MNILSLILNLGKHRHLIVDGYTFYVLNEFIIFAQKQKESTYVYHHVRLTCYNLQTLVSVVRPLKQNYKRLLSEKTRFSMTKPILFSQGISSRNVLLAMQATGLKTYNTTVVFQKISVPSKDNLAPDMNAARACYYTPIQTRFFFSGIPPMLGMQNRLKKLKNLYHFRIKH